MAEQRLLEVKDASKVLGISLGGLRKRIFERRIPIVKIGGRVYIDSHDIDKWIEKHKIHPANGEENGK